jgi:hypothetical protein
MEGYVVAMKINKGVQKKARRMLLYGENGIGKSTLATQFPEPIVLNFEDGVYGINCDSTERIKSFAELQDILVVELVNTQYRTLVLDTADWLEKLLMDEVARQAGKQTVEDIGYGKGYQALEKLWKKVLTMLEFYWHQNRHVVMTCHETIDRFADPEGDTFNFYRPALHRSGSGCVTEWCDEVLFLKHKRFTRKRDEGYNQERHIALSTGERVIVCNKQPAIEAKNRLHLPDEVPMSIESFYEPLSGIVPSFGPAKREPVIEESVPSLSNMF